MPRGRRGGGCSVVGLDSEGLERGHTYTHTVRKSLRQPVAASQNKNSHLSWGCVLGVPGPCSARHRLYPSDRGFGAYLTPRVVARPLQRLSMPRLCHGAGYATAALSQRGAPQLGWINRYQSKFFILDRKFPSQNSSWGCDALVSDGMREMKNC